MYDKEYRISRIVIALIAFIFFSIAFIHEDQSFVIITFLFTIIAYLIGIPGMYVSRIMIRIGDGIRVKQLRIMYYIFLPVVLGIMAGIILYFISAWADSKPTSNELSEALSFGLTTLFFMVVVGICFIVPYVQTIIVLLVHKILISIANGKIDRMTGEEFEEYLATQFRHLGYEVKMTQISRDYGADLIISKDDVVTAVQAKRYENTVGIAAVQQVYAAAAFYDCDNALVVTNSYFSSPAIKMAEKIGVELWDRESIGENFKIQDM